MLVLFVVQLALLFGAIRTLMLYDGGVMAPVEQVTHYSLVFVPIIARRQEEVQWSVIA